MRPSAEGILGGRYRLQRRLGAGGMASVWLAVDERLGRPVAVKLVADTLAGDEAWLRRFQREARAAAAVSHPSVVHVFDYGVEDGRPFLVMEYIAGGTLADRLAAGRADELPDPAAAVRQLLDALVAVHAAGILHRDIKPANLLLDERGHLRLTDFGIAQAEDATALTRTGMVVGTLRYLAPEVAAGDAASVQSDLYSAGVVIRQLAEARATPALDALVAALTADAPGDRPRSAADALALLDEVTAPTRAIRAETARTQRVSASVGTRSVSGSTGVVFGGTRTVSGSTRSVSGGTRTAVMAPRAGGGAGAGGVGGTAALRARPARRASAPLRRPAVLVAAALAAALVIVVIVLAAGGSSSSGGGGVASPAPGSAPVSQQVQALNAIVSGATKR